MTAAELQVCERVGAINETFVSLTDQGWKVFMDLERVGIEDLVDQSGKIKLFKSLDTVFEFLGTIGIKTAVVDSSGTKESSVKEEFLTNEENRIGIAYGEKNGEKRSDYSPF